MRSATPNRLRDLDAGYVRRKRQAHPIDVDPPRPFELSDFEAVDRGEKARAVCHADLLRFALATGRG
jgi:hypothetical protein